MKKKRLKNTRTKNKVQKQKKTSVVTFFEDNIAPYGLWLLLALLFLIGFAAFFDYFTLKNLFYFTDIGSDSLNQNYPAMVHINELLKEAWLSKWSFYKGMGEVYYTAFPTEPLGWLLNPLNKIGMASSPNYLVFRRFLYIFLTQFLFSGILFYLYLRSLSINKFSAILGAVSIVFSAYMVVGSGWGFAGHVFKIVFLLFSFEQLFLKKRWYFFPFAIMLLSGNVFVLYIYSLFLLLYSIFRFSFEKKGNLIDYLKLIGRMVVLGLIGILMNMVHVFRGAIKLFFSSRISGSASYSQALSEGSEIIEHTKLGATTLLRFFSSDILGTGSQFQGWSNYLEAPLFYIGLLTLLMLPQVFIHLNKRNKIIFGSFLGFWLMTLLVPWLRYAFLAFTGDYFRYGFDFFIPFTFLFYAIYALNELDKKLKINYLLLGGTLVVLLIILFFPYSSIPARSIDGGIRKVIVLLLLAYSGLLILMSKAKYKSMAQLALLLLVVVELSWFSYKSYDTRVPVTKREFAKNAGGYKDGTSEAVKYLKQIDPTFYRIEKDYQSGNAIHGSLNDAMAQGYYGTASYSSFNQLNYVRFLEEVGIIQKGNETATRWITGLKGNPLLQTFGNVKYFFSKKQDANLLNWGFDKIATESGISIFKNRYYLPFGYTYDKYISFDDFSKLSEYRLSAQSLAGLKNELTGLADANFANIIVTKLKPMENVVYQQPEMLISTAEKYLGKEQTDKIQDRIIRYSANHFHKQIGLLTAFVYEESGLPKDDVTTFKQVHYGDSTVFVLPQKFTFTKYAELSDSLKSDTLQITKFQQSHIEGEIELASPKMLFLTIPYDAGWQLSVNGEDKKLSRVNIGFTGVVLPKGKHKIVLDYVPQYSVITSSISLISILLFWLFLGYDVFRKRKQK